MHVAVIIAAGGKGTRLGASRPKQLIEIDGQPILQRAVAIFTSHPEVSEVVVVLPADLAAAPPAYLTNTPPVGPRGDHASVTIVAGGAERQDSVANGFDAVRDRADVVVVHDAARPFASADLVSRTIAAAVRTGAALAALPSSDTVKLAAAGRDLDAGPRVERTIPRERIYLAQTPQAFRTGVLRDAIAAGRRGMAVTDEAALAEYVGHPVELVPGEVTNIKITTAADLRAARALAGGGRTESRMRIGTGYDLHRVIDGRPLVLGGVTIATDRGLDGHSDADVLSHAVTDAILGAVAGGDIGRHFPDTDPEWKGASSLAMLRHAVGIARERGYRVSNVDAVVIAERPKLAPHVDAIRERLAAELGVDAGRVGLKGKTNEGIGEIGRGEAMAVHAVAMLIEDSSEEP